MPDGHGGVNGKGPAKRPIRLLEIIGNAIVGGMETYTRNLIAALPRDEFEVDCLLPYESAYTASLRAIGCTVHIAPIHDDPLWRSIEMAAGIVARRGIDVIHANLANAHTLAGIVGRVTGTPAVATVHSRMLWIQEVSVTRLTGMNVITVCQEAHAQALAAGLPPEAVSLIPNGVDTRRFHPGRSGEAFRRSLGVPDGAPLVGYVGRISMEKGPDKFVQVAGRLRYLLPDTHFVMVGEGPAEQDIRAMAANAGLADRLSFAGLRSDVEDVYPALDLLIQTSRSEAMPLALLEAMASGVPAVALAVGGVAEVVQVGETGLLVSPGDWPGVSSRYPGDWEGVAAASFDLLRQPERLAAMGRAARARVEAHYGLDRSVRETAALLRRLAGPSLAKDAPFQPTVVRDKGEGDRRARLKGSAGALAGRRPALAAVPDVS